MILITIINDTQLVLFRSFCLFLLRQWMKCKVNADPTEKKEEKNYQEMSNSRIQIKWNIVNSSSNGGAASVIIKTTTPHLLSNCSLLFCCCKVSQVTLSLSLYYYYLLNCYAQVTFLFLEEEKNRWIELV